MNLLALLGEDRPLLHRIQKNWTWFRNQSGFWTTQNLPFVYRKVYDSTHPVPTLRHEVSTKKGTVWIYQDTMIPDLQDQVTRDGLPRLARAMWGGEKEYGVLYAEHNQHGVRIRRGGFPLTGYYKEEADAWLFVCLNPPVLNEGSNLTTGFPEARAS